MQLKLKIRKGDTVKVITGDAKGQEGKILSVDRKTLKAIVEGVNQVSKHSKPTAAHPNGGIIKKEAPIHVSNLMLVNGTEKASKTAKKSESKTKTTRQSKKSGEVAK